METVTSLKEIENFKIKLFILYGSVVAKAMLEINIADCKMLNLMLNSIIRELGLKPCPSRTAFT